MSDRASISVSASGNELTISVSGKTLLRHTATRPLMSIGRGHPTYRSSHGNSSIRSGLEWKRPLRRLVVTESGDAGVTLRASDSNGVGLVVALMPDPGHSTLVRVRITADPEAVHNRLWIRLSAAHGEPAFGCGEQFSRFNLRGSTVPIWTGEQGVGRGFNVTTLAANIHSRSGGHWHSTYFPQPSYVTEGGRLVHVDTGAYCRFSFAHEEEMLEIWDPACELVLGARDTLAEAVSSLSEFLGRQPPLPEWTHDGMWLGLQGGRDIVRAKVDRAREAGIPLSGVWVQDWVGRRVTAFGSQLFWDWKYDEKLYPDLPAFTAELSGEGIRFLGYLNPFLAIEGELYKEASAKGYCIRKSDGSDYLITVTTFPAAKVDLSNPEAREWFKQIIISNAIGAGLGGWMADYGEYLPPDAVLARANARTYHNRYPAEWARLNHEALAEAGRLEDIAIFMRAGFTGSSRYTHALWAGDQMVDWSRHDGLPSVIPAALSAGMVGIGVTHSDIGGFTSLFGKRRTKELFMRWAEHSAFTPIMRSHESNRPGENWQWDGDEGSITHLARMARIYVALAPYRRSVLAEYARTGLPAMRPVSMHYSGESEGRRVSRYLFGRDLLVAPVLRPGVTKMTVELPDDTWVHLWSGARYSGSEAIVDAASGFPPVFFRAESEHDETFGSAAAI